MGARNFRFKPMRKKTVKRRGAHILYTANEDLERIQYKSLVPIYAYPEMKLLFPNQNHNVLPPSSYTYICERFIYSRIGLPILLQEKRGQIL